MSDGFGCALFLVIVAALGALLFVVAADDNKELEAKRATFYGECLKERKQYDCDLQWDTYVAARSADQSASIAAATAGVSAGVAAGMASRPAR